MGARSITPAFGDPAFEEQLARYHFALSSAKEKTALDIGCGMGFGTCALATAAFLVTGVDADEDQLKFARANYKHPHVDYVRDDLATLSGVRKKFDLACAFGVLERLERPAYEKFIRSVCSHLYPTGTAIFSAGRDVISPEELKSFCAKYFCEVQMLGQMKNRGFVSNMLTRWGLAGSGRAAQESPFRFEPLMYWRPEVGWGESEKFVFAPTLWKKTDSLIAVCRVPKVL
ncbi:MAG TPA: class I SAM-dependent methyltransferase [Bdellovibrionales bacterium]|nr:class I SAM-dependent methyltransferase [Bdellovibrionales bacterium]